MLTGKPPFCKGDILYHHLHSDIPELNTDIPPNIYPQLIKIILNCLAKNPDDRYSDVGHLINDIYSLRKDLS